jgi:hypothetical protein
MLLLALVVRVAVREEVRVLQVTAPALLVLVAAALAALLFSGKEKR